MARKSVAALAIASVAPGAVRLPPPATLTQAERGLWLAVVNSKPAEWFGPEHAPLLANYVRHSLAADVLTQQLHDFDPEWLKDDDGLKRYGRLLVMRERETRAASSLATRMRITQQGVYRADKAATVAGRAAQRKPWQNDSNES